MCGGGGGGWMSCASVCDVRKHVRASMRVCACVYYRFSVLCECFWLLLLMTLLVRLFSHQRNGRSQARRQYKPIYMQTYVSYFTTTGGISLQNYNAIRITTYMYAREVCDLYKDFV